MINKRLLSYMSDAKKYVYLQVLCQWIALLAQIILIFVLGGMMNSLFHNELLNEAIFIRNIAIIIICILVKYIMRYLASALSHYSAENIKLVLREQIYKKLLQLNVSYPKYVSTSQMVQLSVEGVDQLEIYFGKYLPQFFYSMLAPITLFIILINVEWKASLVLLVCVPLIPMSIVMVQKFAKKLLSKYWGLYGNLGDRFLDNIKGLTTLKIYQSDAKKHDEMNEEAERFRKITMKVLIMQLNSISVMDLVAFGGAAIGIIITLNSYMAGSISLGNTFVMIMLSAEFFIPLRLLGSFFHIAMNGNAAAAKIFDFLDIDIKTDDTQKIDKTIMDIQLNHVNYSYDKEKTVVKDISLSMKGKGSFGIVGESGSGKSTLSGLIAKNLTDFEGKIQIAGQDILNVDHNDLMDYITVVDHQAFLFKGSIKSNLLYGNPNADEQMMYHALKLVNLYDFVMSQDGLDTKVSEKASNLSGGQAQRLSIARALLHDTPIYLFDEATSNIDVESENDIMEVIHKLAKDKMVIMITHRLANVKDFGHIFVLQNGALMDEGTHANLMNMCDIYRHMVNTQNNIEQYIGGEYHE